MTSLSQVSRELRKAVGQKKRPGKPLFDKRFLKAIHVINGMEVIIQEPVGLSKSTLVNALSRGSVGDGGGGAAGVGPKASFTSISDAAYAYWAGDGGFGEELGDCAGEGELIPFIKIIYSPTKDNEEEEPVGGYNGEEYRTKDLCDGQAMRAAALEVMYTQESVYSADTLIFAMPLTK
ncbi:hypothetical protein M422DRAFT_53303 [Sphaerobolus stellatus SS14]|uniref:Uncharacterized protein n=1 Tax=Sphaerobolus stellatus (strain SS14) TaxID=990650 RepID=A0A0C9UAQ7_SPHS4|nr:hypothetical protein M422DRAFT_53303 [Sphaerobolus stellatus SS14]